MILLFTMVNGMMLAAKRFDDEKDRLPDLNNLEWLSVRDPFGDFDYLICLRNVVAVRLVEKDKVQAGPPKVVVPGSGRAN